MKIQKILSLFVVLCFVSVCFVLCGFKFFKSEKTQAEKNLVQATSSLENNDVWCVTFQLVWNEFMKKINDGQPIKFVGGNTKLADELNKQQYTKEDISPDSYYIADGVISKKLKKEIEKNIKKKFNEKSDILDIINWNVENGYLFYSMLKKNFKFNVAFDKFDKEQFNKSDEKVKFFGINSKSDKKLYKNVEVLFYNSLNDFAVKLLTKENEDILLYRTDSKDLFELIFDELKAKTKISDFTSKDVLKVPELVVDKIISYDELCGKKIEGTNYIISQALQTIKFKLDNEGGSLKSEAAIAIMKTALMPEEDNKRYFVFNKPFVMFLIEQGKEKPYYAMRVDDTKYLVK